MQIIPELIVAPVLLGLSSGVYCFAHCLPFVAPVMVSEEHGRRENLSIVFKFILGRFVGYMVFGALAGYLGERFLNVDLNIVFMAAMALLSIALILHAVGLFSAEQFSFCLPIKKYNRKLPLLMGFLMGVNVCTPFLLSLTYVFTLGSPAKGVIYFLMFFVGTTVYFIPVYFLGCLGRFREFQVAGKISAIVVGGLFFIYSLYNLVVVFL